MFGEATGDWASTLADYNELHIGGYAGRSKFLKRILVVSKNDLLLIGIERLIGQNHAYSIHTSIAVDEQAILHQIRQIGLDVIIIECSANQTDIDRVMRLMNASDHLRVVTLEINSNQIQIYDKREVILRGSEDLVSYL